MSDDLERRLDELYEKLDAPARRVRARWQVRPATLLPWIAAGAAAAAVLLAFAFWSKAPPPPAPAPVARPRPPLPAPEPPPPPPVLTKLPDIFVNTPEPPPPARPEPPASAPVPEPPRPVPKPAPPEPPRREEPRPPTRGERAVAVVREIDGAFEIGDRAYRGKQKDFALGAGDYLKASTAVKLSLADDRFLLVAPRALIELRPDGKRLQIQLEQGELLAELVGPGPEVRVTTRLCEVQPVGTVFAVRADPKKTTVSVERGRVDVRGAKGQARLRAGEASSATEDGAVSAPAPADFRSLAWTRPHRPAELAPFAEDFLKPGAWKAEVAQGVARALPQPGSGPMIRLEAEHPTKPLFEVPVRGALTLVYRSDRASRMYVQLFAADLRVNFRKDLSVLRGAAWRTLVVDFDEFVSVDRAKHAGKLPPGTPVTDLGIVYGEEGEKGNFWVDSIKATEVRP